VLVKEPPTFIVPAPVKVNWQPVVPVVTVPAMVSVPVEIVIISLRVVVVESIVSEPVENVPAPTLMVKFVLLEPGLAICVSPVTAKV
jgi:hypothetical protein